MKNVDNDEIIQWVAHCAIPHTKAVSGYLVMSEREAREALTGFDKHPNENHRVFIKRHNVTTKDIMRISKYLQGIAQDVAKFQGI